MLCAVTDDQQVQVLNQTLYRPYPLPKQWQSSTAVRVWLVQLSRSCLLPGSTSSDTTDCSPPRLAGDRMWCLPSQLPRRPGTLLTAAAEIAGAGNPGQLALETTRGPS
jgi:hypothetical protein